MLNAGYPACDVAKPPESGRMRPSIVVNATSYRRISIAPFVGMPFQRRACFAISTAEDYVLQQIEPAFSLVSAPRR